MVILNSWKYREKEDKGQETEQVVLSITYFENVQSLIWPGTCKHAQMKLFAVKMMNFTRWKCSHTNLVLGYNTGLGSNSFCSKVGDFLMEWLLSLFQRNCEQDWSLSHICNRLMYTIVSPFVSVFSTVPAVLHIMKKHVGCIEESKERKNTLIQNFARYNLSSDWTVLF